MQENLSDEKFSPDFRDFLKTSARPFLLIILLAFAVRIVFITVFPLHTGDGDTQFRYLPTALNILQGNGYSIDQSPPYRTSEACVPFYPLFLAGVFAIFGQNHFAVALIQVFIDIATCLLVAFVSFKFAPLNLKKSAALVSLAVYGLFSWFTLIWVSRLLTETIALFLTVSVVAFCIIGIEKTGYAKYAWLGAAGFVCGIAILTRPDSVLLLGGVLIFLGFRFLIERSRAVFISILSFCLAVAFALSPWVVHNYVNLGRFQPLASEWGWAQPGFMPTGYLHWIRTWMIDETYFWYVFHQAFTQGDTPFETAKMPDSMFDSAEERERVTRLMDEYNQTFYFTPEIDRGFRQIAEERIERAPLRFFVVLPVQRITSLWVTGFATSNYRSLILRILSVLPILIGGVAAFVIWGRHSDTGQLLISIILTRTLFLGYHYAPETRYIVEAYPLMIASCGVTAAFVWLLLQERLKAKYSYPLRS